MLICELAILLGLRGIHVPSHLKKKDLENLFNPPITQIEIDNLAKWNQCSTHQYTYYLADNIYVEYSLVELKCLLELKLGHTFPVPLTFVNSKHKLLAYYHLRGYSLIFPKPVFTEEQNILLTQPNYLKNPNLPYIIVTNAGAGTGKTTVANERANLLKYEGVILVSYTNAAIDQNYKRLHQYSKMKGILGKKDYAKKLNVTTVDSIAGYANRMNDNESSHDISIRTAINRFMTDPETYNLFAISGQGLMYNHLIADECQDIDDLRGELILTMFKVLGMKSLVLFGDPRQRIKEGCGKWYTDLWSEEIDREESKFIEENKITQNSRILSNLPTEDEFEKLMNGYVEPEGIKTDLLKAEIQSLFETKEITEPEEKKINYVMPNIENSTIPYVYTLINKNVDIKRVGFTYSHRFQNPQLVDLANSLSRRRLHIHHELKAHPNNKMIPSEIPICFMGLDQGYDDMQLSKIAIYIRDTLHRDNNVPYSEIAFVTPTLAKENKISTFSQNLYSVLKSHGIPCYSKTEGSYQPIGVLFSTIHSIKGCEFDYVFAIGISGYPEIFHMIAYSEAESLVFVLHTRARKKMFYISANDTFRIPRGVNPEFINKSFKSSRLRIQNSMEKEPSIASFIVTEMCKDFSLHKLLSTNGFNLGLVSKLIPEDQHKNDNICGRFDNRLPPIPEGIDSRFWGVMCGMAIEMCLINLYPLACREFNNKTYKAVPYSVYITMVQQGQIVKGRHIINNTLIICENCINTPNQEEMIKLSTILKKNIETLDWDDLITLGKIYDYIISSSTQSRYSVNTSKKYDLIPVFKSIALEIISKFGLCLGTEIHVSGFKVRGCLDAIFNDYIIEFKTLQRNFELKDLLQVWLYSILKRQTMADVSKRWPVLINLQTGEYSIVQSDRTLVQWDYIISSFVQLKIHVDLVTYRMNKLIANGKYVTLNGQKVNVPFVPPKFANNTFVVDTEFSGYTGNPEIFDLAAVNLNDPYRSLIVPIKISDGGLPFACKWMQCTRERFDTSKTLQEVQSIFFKIIMLNSTVPVTLMHYIAKVDVSWWPQCIPLDVGKKAREFGVKNGFFMDGSSPPTLSSLYGSIACLLESQTHLRIHTALSDSLLLYEMALLDLL